MTPLLPDPDGELDARNPLVITVDDLLTDDECRALVERIEEAGPTAAPITTSSGFVMRPDIRNNTRVMFDDYELADLLFQRISPHVPRRLERQWELSGTNERLRCYRYDAGQYFAPHFDGAFVRDRDERSLLTFMVYLNDCTHGGATNFLSLDRSVTPRTGTALLFNHHLLHEGAEVTAGRKYALRTDLMYRRIRS
ncbi:2OG-Fe(II) oxygenase [Myxococcus sp. CA051A]|uniref:2OG-Fe(II) oxygenase n=1 Tax=Myxococcus llanfairpwllgwyngyllgogerychwyrndrobwllllantysiliogogogochensis TaxID=2590453 RepID=A0A540WS02_9BACT|nr:MULTISPECIES: 2OG-Fe(II) oxygenase [Myxococcus]NTX07808.1 2OG-Fe(II) oxygenase [Myxococcus sp. CA040A]NTX16040.1 2OG-Fe(II) oxygenase [Myxococcus sp. CA056]NTX40969.1 2OG-Fe(II) oxygenase [Myxococcus sp. CA033]NTX54562.1 2OG-Fe(II) oxygenase [Myxococcus sp. CA039A]NTX67328.1 2OG-Fe(II) oxygenase [Myxococcus sp. CA051A]